MAPPLGLLRSTCWGKEDLLQPYWPGSGSGAFGLFSFSMCTDPYHWVNSCRVRQTARKRALRLGGFRSTSVAEGRTTRRVMSL